jgi:EpsI family protein
MKFPLSLHVIGTLVLLSATLAGSTLLERRTSHPLVHALDTIPWEIAGFQGASNPPITEGVQRELRATSYLSRSYSKGSLKADVLVIYYAQQRAGESMHSPKHCMPGAGWEIWRHGSAQMPFRGGHIEINKYFISNSGVRRVMFYWYQSRQRIIANEYLGKLLLARDTLVTGDTSGSIVRIILPDTPDAEQAGMALSTELARETGRCLGS